MSSLFTQRLFMAVPIAMKDGGNLFARSIDWDTGGDKSFGSSSAALVAAPTVVTHYVMDVLITDAIAATWSGFTPATVLANVTADKAARPALWAGVTLPTLAQTTAALALVHVTIEARGLRTPDQLLAAKGLVAVVPASILP